MDSVRFAVKRFSVHFAYSFYITVVSAIFTPLLFYLASGFISNLREVDDRRHSSSYLVFGEVYYPSSYFFESRLYSDLFIFGMIGCVFWNIVNVSVFSVPHKNMDDSFENHKKDLIRSSVYGGIFAVFMLLCNMLFGLVSSATWIIGPASVVLSQSGYLLWKRKQNGLRMDTLGVRVGTVIMIGSLAVLLVAARG